MLQAGNAELFWAPEGNLVSSTFDANRTELIQGVEKSSNGWSMLVIDMNNVVKIDTRGIQLISEFYQWTQKYDRQFMLMNVDPSILRFLRLFRLHTKFPIGLNKTSAQLEEEEHRLEEEEHRLEEKERLATTVNVRGDVPRKVN